MLRAAYDLIRDFCWYFFFGAVFLIALFYLFNSFADFYKKDRKKFAKASAALSLKEEELTGFALTLPLPYQFQWQLFLRCPTKRAGEVFKFLPRPKRIYFLLLPAAASFFCLLLAFLEARFYPDTTSYVIYGGVTVGFIFCFCAQGVLAGNRFKEKKANKAFDNLVSNMDLMFGNYHPFGYDLIEPQTQCCKENFADVMKKIRYLKSKGVNEQTAARLAELLSKEKLNRVRTVKQQQVLNEALNGLVRYVSLRDNKEQNVKEQEVWEQEIKAHNAVAQERAETS